MQGHNKENCKAGIRARKKEEQAKKIEHNNHNQEQQYPLQKGNARILSSGKVVGDPGNWSVVKDRRSNLINNNPHTNKEEATKDTVGNTENNKGETTVFGPVLQGEKTKDNEHVGSLDQQSMTKPVEQVSQILKLAKILNSMVKEKMRGLSVAEPVEDSTIAIRNEESSNNKVSSNSPKSSKLHDGGMSKGGVDHRILDVADSESCCANSSSHLVRAWGVLMYQIKVLATGGNIPKLHEAVEIY